MECSISYFFNFRIFRTNDDEEDIGNFKRPVVGSTGASLRASTRGELGSSMLQRSLRLRKSTASTAGQP